MAIVVAVPPIHRRASRPASQAIPLPNDGAGLTGWLANVAGLSLVAYVVRPDRGQSRGQAPRDDGRRAG